MILSSLFSSNVSSDYNPKGPPLASESTLWHYIRDQLKTSMDENSENIDSPGERSRSLDVADWINLNLEKWREWDFNISEVYRTPKHHFIFQPVHPALREIGEPVKALRLGGTWYRTGIDIERKLEKFIWAAWFLAIIVFSLALLTYSKGLTYFSLALFVLMYAILEGFSPFTLAKLASDRKTSNIDIALTSLTKVVHFEKPGIILLSWMDGDDERGVAFKMTPNKSDALVSRIKEQSITGIDIRVEPDANPFAPPVKKAVK